MTGKKFLTGVLAGLLAFGALDAAQAATREEISAIEVNDARDFQYWSAKSKSKQKLIRYVNDVTNPASKNFIPIEDRIAVFDMDGTILCETAPYYFDGMIFIHRALHDENYTPAQADRDFAAMLENCIRTGDFSNKLSSSAPHQASVFAGMTEAEHAAYVKNFAQTSVEGLSNLQWGEAFYLPMVEVIKYLQANDFQVYIVSGSERALVRTLVCDLLNIPANHIIGTDIKIFAANQNGADGLNYTYSRNDYLVRGEFVFKNLKMNKVENIAQEIGKQPVLAFGNSSGDAAMFNYTITNNKHKALAFALLCDDTKRELGNLNSAEKMKKSAAENGWVTISMKNDFKTIYGDNVRRN